MLLIVSMLNLLIWDVCFFGCLSINELLFFYSVFVLVFVMRVINVKILFLVISVMFVLMDIEGMFYWVLVWKMFRILSKFVRRLMSVKRGLVVVI